MSISSTLRRSEVIHLCFHGIGVPGRDLEEGESTYWIQTSCYLRILDEIIDRQDVEISFDDGNKSDVTIGLPAIVERAMSASFFPIAGRVGRDGSLDSADLHEVSRLGMRVGTHGMNHKPWPTLSVPERAEEYYAARAMLAEIVDRPITAAAMPLGRYDRRVLTDLRAAGYQTVYSSDRRPARRTDWLQPRYSLTAADDVSTVRSILSGPGFMSRVAGAAKGFVKRWI